MNSEEGLQRIQEEVAMLIRRVESQVGKLKSHGHNGPECEANPPEHVIIRHQKVGMILRWRQRWTNSLEDSGLFVERYNSKLLFHSELGAQMYSRRPEVVQTHHFDPDISRRFAYGWRAANGASDFISTESLADLCLIKFIDLIEGMSKDKWNESPFTSSSAPPSQICKVAGREREEAAVMSIYRLGCGPGVRITHRAKKSSICRAAFFLYDADCDAG